MHKKKQKIVFCLRDMQLGGAESVLVRVLEQLLERNDLEISFVSYVNISEPFYAEWFRKHPEIKHCVLYPCPWLGTKLKRFFLLRIIQHWTRDIYRWGKRVFIGCHVLKNADVVIDYYDFGFRKEFKNLHAKKIAWWHSSINKFFSKNCNTKFIKDYDLFVALTDGFVEEFKQRLPQYKNKIVRIYNPIDINSVQKKIVASKLPDFNEYFVCVARLSQDKDIETVLRAFDMFWQKNNQPNVYMVFVGGGDQKKYREIADRLIAQKNIVFVGPQKNPFGFMRGALANILSSHSEGMAMVLVESMLAGTLNIASDCKNGPREILLHGNAGLLFVPGDAEKLAQHMEVVWNKQVPVQKLIKAASDSCHRFDAKNVMPDIIKLF